MNNKFLQACLGISVILIAAGFFVRSFGTAKAAPIPTPAGTQMGRYQAAFGRSNSNSNALKLVVWDSETGSVKLYQVADNLSAGAIAQLPLFPLE